MNLDKSEEGQMIGMEDSLVEDEDHGRKKSKRNKKKRSRKNKNEKGYIRCLKDFKAGPCDNERDCGPYGSCQRFPNFPEYTMGDPVLV